MTDEIFPQLTPAGRPVYGIDFTVSVSMNFGAASSAPRWGTKATAFAQAWMTKYGTAPSKWAVSCACAVAQHETLCGDAWPGEFNWGAIQLRVLTAAEKTVLASVPCTPQSVKDARTVLAAAVEAGTIPAEPNGALHVDSSPGKGWYWVFFHAFVDDVAGAAYFLHVLCDQRPASLPILNQALGAWRTDLFNLANVMYQTHYYEGFRIPTSMYTAPDGTQVTGAVMNVLDYSGSLIGIAPGIFSALQILNWSATPGKMSFDLSTTFGVQSALTYLAGKLSGVWNAIDPLGVDGVLGPKTEKALTMFQKLSAIPITGKIDAQTVAMLRTALDKAQA